MATGEWVSRDGCWWVGVRTGWCDNRGRLLPDFYQVRYRREVVAEVRTIVELAGVVPLHELVEQTVERPPD